MVDTLNCYLDNIDMKTKSFSFRSLSSFLGAVAFCLSYQTAQAQFIGGSGASSQPPAGASSQPPAGTQGTSSDTSNPTAAEPPVGSPAGPLAGTEAVGSLSTAQLIALGLVAAGVIAAAVSSGGGGGGTTGTN